MLIHGLVEICKDNKSATGVNFKQYQKEHQSSGYEFVISSPKDLPEHQLEIHVFARNDLAAVYCEGIRDSQTNWVQASQPGGPNNCCVIVAKLSKQRFDGTLEDAILLIEHNPDVVVKLSEQVQRDRKIQFEKELAQNIRNEWSYFVQQASSTDLKWQVYEIYPHNKDVIKLSLQDFTNGFHCVTLQRQAEGLQLSFQLSDITMSSYGVKNCAEEELQRIALKNRWSFDGKNFECQSSFENSPNQLSNAVKMQKEIGQICSLVKECVSTVEFVSDPAIRFKLQTLNMEGAVLEVKEGRNNGYIIDKRGKETQQIMSTALSTMIRYGLVEQNGYTKPGNQRYKVSPKTEFFLKNGKDRFLRALVDETCLMWRSAEEREQDTSPILSRGI